MLTFTETLSKNVGSSSGVSPSPLGRVIQLWRWLIRKFSRRNLTNTAKTNSPYLPPPIYRQLRLRC